jgi:leader peptidase (prepilin peptidase)/N-methyltransferase
VILALPDLRELLSSPLFEPLSLALGLIVGSFANVCIHRLPLGQSVVHPPSRCPHCGESIRARDNVPVLSFLLLGGRCRACRTLIPLRYPLVEAANGLLWLGLAVLGGPTLQTFVSMLLATALLVLSLIDLDHHLLPNAITLPGVALGLLASFLPGSEVSPLGAAAAAGGGYLAFLSVAKIYEKTRGVEGLGQGDWKMTAMLGAFLGWQKMLLTVFLASVAGTLVGFAFIAFRGRDMRYALPLGTFLGAAGIAVLFAGDSLVAWYSAFFNG